MMRFSFIVLLAFVYCVNGLPYNRASCSSLGQKPCAQGESAGCKCCPGLLKDDKGNCVRKSDCPHYEGNGQSRGDQFGNGGIGQQFGNGMQGQQFPNGMQGQQFPNGRPGQQFPNGSPDQLFPGESNPSSNFGANGGSDQTALMTSEELQMTLQGLSDQNTPKNPEEAKQIQDQVKNILRELHRRFPNQSLRSFFQRNSAQSRQNPYSKSGYSETPEYLRWDPRSPSRSGYNWNGMNRQNQNGYGPAGDSSNSNNPMMPGPKPNSMNNRNPTGFDQNTGLPNWGNQNQGNQFGNPNQAHQFGCPCKGQNQPINPFQNDNQLNQNRGSQYGARQGFNRQMSGSWNPTQSNYFKSTISMIPSQHQTSQIATFGMG